MNRRTLPALCALAAALFVSSAAAGADGAAGSGVLTFIELARRTDAPSRVALTTDLPIVDINSTIRIELDRSALANRAARFAPSDAAISAGELAAITDLLGREARVIALFDPAGARAVTPGAGPAALPDANAILKFMDELLTAIVAVSERAPSLRAVANDILGAEPPDPNAPPAERERFTMQEYGRLVAAVRLEVQRLGVEVARLSAQRVRFRLGAWVLDRAGGERPVHVPQFDTLESGRFVEVPRFAAPAGSELAAQLESARLAADSFNEAGVAGIAAFAVRYTGIAREVSRAKSSLDGALAELAADPALRSAGDAELARGMTDAKLTAQRIGERGARLAEQAAALARSTNPLLDSAVLIASLPSLFEGLAQDAASLQDALSRLASRLRSAQATAFAARLDALREQLGAVAEKFAAERGLLAVWNASGASDHPDTYSTFSDQVLALTINEIPEATEIDLRSIGPRSEGDEVRFSLSMEQASAEGARAAGVEVDRRTVRLYQIGWHANLSAGVVFLQPLPGANITLPSPFLAAPSYSVLLHRGSRASRLWNEFASLGVGLNVAAPDLNRDGTPEVALGLVVSTARDYVQGGVGYDVGLGALYWYFGVRLPLGTFEVPVTSSGEALGGGS